MITYNKLFKLLKERNLESTALTKVISIDILSEIKKGTDKIDINTIDKICMFLDCQPSDIMTCYETIDIGINQNGNMEYIYKETGNYKNPHILNMNEINNFQKTQYNS